MSIERKELTLEAEVDRKGRRVRVGGETFRVVPCGAASGHDAVMVYDGVSYIGSVESVGDEDAVGAPMTLACRLVGRAWFCGEEES